MKSGSLETMVLQVFSYHITVLVLSSRFLLNDLIILGTYIKSEKAVSKENNISFEELFSEDLEILEQHRTKITYLKGENIFKQGAFAPHIIYVLNGLVKIYLQTGYDKQINLGIAQSGDFLAFSSIFGETIYTYSSQALSDTDVCMIEKESLKAALLRNPTFALQVTSKNYRNESHLLEILKNVSYKQMPGKLASALLYL